MAQGLNNTTSHGTQLEHISLELDIINSDSKTKNARSFKDLF